ncbi:septum formation inhibitor Maf [Vibrio sp. S17_S38]|uniref:Maf family protein n=1 Tax=Vibrio sp. S17_S38 TaxID=2720229 RepID=UPI0016811093|nr:Maf family protein [Vibrio sp. S17_S38]MBD1571751.1 septum formation inhibitor Maf [Vibrio sp. S17_S38]
MQHTNLILASTSIYRKALLEKLAVPFTVLEPQCDEAPLTGENAQQLVTRLAQKKAQSCRLDLAKTNIVIGSDQVCIIDDEIIGKPLNRENAVAQLSRSNGRSITFYTGIAVYNSTTNKCDVELDTFIVHFRKLSLSQIENYVDKEQPFYCAGSFKSEGLGIALFERLEGSDPNSLIGLPLITLINMLEKQGITIL